LGDDPIALQRLRDAAEESKIDLSDVKETHIQIEAITMSDKGPLNLETTLSRAKFEDLVGDMIKMTIPPMEQAIEDANLNTDKIDAVLLVGGSTRIPMVQNIVREFTQKQPHRDIVPEEVVALGAAVQSLVIAPIEGEIEETLAARYGKEKPVIIHMTPFSLGVGLINDQFGAIIERNSTYPTEAKDIFTTTRDFQEAISFPIYEGEEHIASENTFLDMLRIEGITPAPRGVPRIEVTFRLNPDRILEATAEDLATGVEKKITIAATDNRLGDTDKNRMITEAKERVTRTLRQRISESVIDEADNIVKRAEKAIASQSGPAADELRGRIDNAKRMIKSGGGDGLEDLIDDINRRTTELEAAG
jgi:molecular chaperone DnaK